MSREMQGLRGQRRRSRESQSPRELHSSQQPYSSQQTSGMPNEWWDTHVYRTHLLRGPPGTPNSSRDEEKRPFTPRSLKASGMHLAGLNARAKAPPELLPASPASYPPFAEGALLPPNPRAWRLEPILRNANKIVSSTHPAFKELTDLHKAMKMLDVHNTEVISPTDVVRGLATVAQLTEGSNKVSELVQNHVIKHMQPNGMISYSGFIQSLAADKYITEAIQAASAAAKAEKTRLALMSNPVETEATAAEGPKLRPGVTADDLRKAQALIKDKFFDKFSGFQQAFRSIDKDGSGYINRNELEACLHNLNLSMLRKDVIDTLVDFIDCENDLDDDTDGGPTDIGYREFARAFATDDIMSMRPLATLKKAPPPPTPPPHNTTPSNVSSLIKTKFKPDDLRKAFDFMDQDNSGLLSRAEVKRVLASWGMTLTEKEMLELFKKCDVDGSGTINYNEFLDMVQKSPALVAPRELAIKPALRPGVRSEDVRKAQQIVKQKYTDKFKRMDAAFKNIDKDRTGTITRDELITNWAELNLVGIIPAPVAQTLIDFIDIDDFGEKIEFKEFARVICADDVMSLAPLKAAAPAQVARSLGRKSMSDMPGAQGLTWVTGT